MIGIHWSWIRPSISWSVCSANSVHFHCRHPIGDLYVIHRKMSCVRFHDLDARYPQTLSLNLGDPSGLCGPSKHRCDADFGRNDAVWSSMMQWVTMKKEGESSKDWRDTIIRKGLCHCHAQSVQTVVTQWKLDSWLRCQWLFQINCIRNGQQIRIEIQPISSRWIQA